MAESTMTYSVIQSNRFRLFCALPNIIKVAIIKAAPQFEILVARLFINGEYDSSIKIDIKHI